MKDELKTIRYEAEPTNDANGTYIVLRVYANNMVYTPIAFGLRNDQVTSIVDEMNKLLFRGL